jgi:hypothetical protein|tara:strand:- start:2447 stop:2671 length:225 start_codon:yes stop_codon:yes gene_type:complete
MSWLISAWLIFVDPELNAASNYTAYIFETKEQCQNYIDDNKVEITLELFNKFLVNPTPLKSYHYFCVSFYEETI